MIVDLREGACTRAFRAHVLPTGLRRRPNLLGQTQESEVGTGVVLTSSGFYR
ncbi:hypothetical protein J6590_032303 [Homalodisca vitripennis]|nr:hypothetical protein J6590_032303 [Homalodisca vitripennis]